MKKYLLPFAAIGAGIIVAIPFLSSCANPRNETEVMMDLYKTNSESSTPTQCADKNAYFKLWTDLAQTNTSTVGIADINWCLEYSLFQHFILSKGCSFTTGISLDVDDNVYDHIPNDITPSFRTTIGSVEYIDGSLKFNYIGYLQLNVTRQINFSDDEVLNPGDSIQIIYTFTNFTFNIGCVKEHASGDFFTEVISAPVPGNHILTIEVSQGADLFLQSFPTTPNENDIIIPNYFQAKQP